jgi:glycosyltransferase involved in cell wall biosynthesis
VKILIITAKYPPQRCGIGNYTSFLLDHLIKNKCEVKIITSGHQRKKKNIYSLIKKNIFLDIIKIINFVNKFNPEIVHFQYAPTSFKNNFLVLFLTYFFYLQKKKILFSWHEFFSKSTLIYCILLLVIKPVIIVVRNNFKRKLNFLAKLLKPKIIYIKSSVTLNFDSISKKKISKNNFMKKKFKRLFIFFGFLYPHKNIEIITKIINLKKDFVIISTHIDKNNIYHNKVVKHLKQKKFVKNFKIKYLNDANLSKVLKLSDAIILPFKDATGDWNTTINNAISSKSFVLTSSKKFNGYYKEKNIYYSKFNNIDDMKNALNKYSSKKNKYFVKTNTWDEIANKHIKVYNYLCKS